MSLNIVWTDRASETFELTLQFIETKWGLAAAKKFAATTNSTISLIRNQPYLYKAILADNTRKALISKQTSMLYVVHSSHITILLFWDNRQEPAF